MSVLPESEGFVSKWGMEEIYPEELYNHVKQDDLYFRATGGGVTFGGGEPLLSCKEILHFHKIYMDKGHDWKINILLLSAKP